MTIHGFFEFFRFFETCLGAVLAQAAQTGNQSGAFAGQQPIEGDFRQSVWIAYGLVLLMLALFSIFLVFHNRSVERRLAHLQERLEHAQSGKGSDGDGGDGHGGDG